MDHGKFKKIICALGHSSDVIPWDMPLPKKCPVCGQPYDRRYNVPIVCLEDGTVLEEDGEKVRQEEIRKSQNLGDRESEFPVSRRKRILLEKEAAAGEPIVERRHQESGRTTGKEITLYSDGRKIVVSEQKKYLGRDEAGADIFLMNRLVSRRHAQIYGDRFGNVYVRDADSLNGTYADDGGGRRKLLPGETAVLKSGDRLWLADQLLVIEGESE